MIVASLLLAASTAYQLLCLFSALAWKRRPPFRAPSVFEPSVAILKPLCGADPELRENLRSFCRQDYARFQVVFGALDPNDPALLVAEEVRDEFPALDVRVVRGAGEPGHNRKIATLLTLFPHADAEILVLADSDMRVRPDYLSRLIIPFAEPGTGLVTCPYRGKDARGLASSLEALGIGADFIPSVFLADRLRGMSFAFGATIALRSATLHEIGGFERLRDELADDYLLGARVAARGGKVILSEVIVDSVLGGETPSEMLARRLRWMRTVRAMRPAGYAGLGITQTTTLAAVLFAVTGGSGWGLLLGGTAMAVRIAAACAIARFCTNDPNLPKLAWLLPAADLVSCGIWFCGLFGRTVKWRGRRFRLLHGGRIEPMPPN